MKSQYEIDVAHIESQYMKINIGHINCQYENWCGLQTFNVAHSNRTTLFCIIREDYHSELRFTDINIFHQLNYIIFFGVHTNYTIYDV